MARGRTGQVAVSATRRAYRRFVLTVLLLCGLVGVSVGAGVYWRRVSLAATVRHGLALLSSAEAAGEAVEALSEWEARTGGRWKQRPQRFVAYVLEHHSLADARVRKLLTWVTGADYGDRRDDWERWFETWSRLRGGQTLKIAGRQQVRLEPRWKAPVGLTAWFSTIIPLDGKVYVASLGAAFDDASDIADGIVCVDGRSGQAELIFHPPEGRVRDIVGIAAGDGCLFAACWNGLVYCLEPDGRLRWSARVGAPLGAPPLSLDINRDGVSDAIVVSHHGRVAAISGRGGQTVWVAPAPRLPADRPADRPHVGATLAAGALNADGVRHLLVSTPDGSLRVLAARNGKVQWEGRLRAGSVAGTLVSGPLAAGPPAYVGDRAGWVWSLLRAGTGFELASVGNLSVRSDEGLVAALRTLSDSGRVAGILACPCGASVDPGASVCVLDPAGVRWRYAPGGAIWATPAVADINGDGETEIIVASVIGADGDIGGLLTVLSARGHCLRREVLPAAVDCSPVVSDVDGDGKLEVLVADRAGWLHCWATNRIGPVEWGVLGGDSHNTRNSENAYAFGQVPVGAQWRWQPR